MFIVLLINAHLRDRDDETASPFADVRHLLHDLVLEIPRQNEHVVGARLADALGRMNGNVRPRRAWAAPPRRRESDRARRAPPPPWRRKNRRSARGRWCRTDSVRPVASGAETPS